MMRRRNRWYMMVALTFSVLFLWGALTQCWHGGMTVVEEIKPWERTVDVCIQPDIREGDEMPTRLEAENGVYGGLGTYIFRPMCNAETGWCCGNLQFRMARTELEATGLFVLRVRQPDQDERPWKQVQVFRHLDGTVSSELVPSEARLDLHARHWAYAHHVEGSPVRDWAVLLVAPGGADTLPSTIDLF